MVERIHPRGNPPVLKPVTSAAAQGAVMHREKSPPREPLPLQGPTDRHDADSSPVEVCEHWYDRNGFCVGCGADGGPETYGP
jgi:hypothetical protein